MSCKIVIPDYRAKSRNKTAYRHWRTYQKYRDEIAELIMFYAKDKTEIDPARVTLEAYFKGRRVIDTSNLDDKLAVDGLMKAGILKDDTPFENPEIIKRVYPETGENKLVIMVEQCSQNQIK
ncbi:MAG: hypothetical protein R6U02_00390 [Alkalibacterium sp.]|uniref:hypothetical protein n=1 Tax=Alkalibacterium sp. TaxID=1872447 RepID=UPI00397057E1